MLRRIGALSTVLVVAALTALLAAEPARADGSVNPAVANPVAISKGGTVITCTVSGYATWHVYPEGDADVVFGGTTTCLDRPVQMNGTATLSSGGVPVAGNSFSKLLANTGSAYGLIASTPGTSYQIQYTTTMWAPIGFSWTTVPAGCTVSAPKITCTMAAPFTVS